MPLPHDPGPHWGEVGIHGLHRQREWDVVTVVEAPGLTGPESDDVWFVALDGGVVLADPSGIDVAPLRDALVLETPYRAHAVPRARSVWAVAAKRIETVELADDPGGSSIELTWDGYERTTRIDGAPTLAGVPQLEALASKRHETYVVRAERLVGDVWEVSVTPL